MTGEVLCTGGDTNTINLSRQEEHRVSLIGDNQFSAFDTMLDRFLSDRQYRLVFGDVETTDISQNNDDRMTDFASC
jgi:hypothetical protein